MSPRLSLVLRFLLTAVALSGRSLIAAELPSPTAGATAMPFNIPAQPLAAALLAYSRTTGIQVLYDSRLRVSRRSAPVTDVATPDNALRTLLQGTGLTADFTDTNDVVLRLIQPAGTAAEILPLPDAPVLTLDTLRVSGPLRLSPTTHDGVADRLYEETVQADILRVLQRDPTTQNGRYRVLIKLWIDGAGSVQTCDLMRTTGDKVRDLAILRILRGLTMSRTPPAGLPQPIGVVLTFGG